MVAMLLLIPYWGLYGAAIASGSAQALKNLFVWWHVRRRAVWLNAPIALSLNMLLWGGAVGICYTLKLLVPGPSYVQLAIGLLVFVCVALIAIRSPVLSHTDRELFHRLFQGRETRFLRFIGILNHPSGVQGTP